MGARSKARKRAVDVLFEADQRRRTPTEVLEQRQSRGDAVVSPYSIELVEGVVAHQSEIDEWLQEHSVDWPLERMPAVDRAVLRIGVYEILWSDDVPDAVAVDEAVELAKDLSTDESPGFVNGLLGRLIDLKPELERARHFDSVRSEDVDSSREDESGQREGDHGLGNHQDLGPPSDR